MTDPMTKRLVNTVMEPTTLQCIATSSKELTTITKKSMNQIQIRQKLHKGHKLFCMLLSASNKLDKRSYCIDKTSANLLYPTYDLDLCDIDNVLSVGLFDLTVEMILHYWKVRKMTHWKKNSFWKNMIQHCALSLKVVGIHLQVLRKVDVAALLP